MATYGSAPTDQYLTIGVPNPYYQPGTLPNPAGAGVAGGAPALYNYPYGVDANGNPLPAPAGSPGSASEPAAPSTSAPSQTMGLNSFAPVNPSGVLTPDQLIQSDLQPNSGSEITQYPQQALDVAITGDVGQNTAQNQGNPFATPGISANQVQSTINQYISAAGVTNTDNGAYWVTAWNTWGSQNPAYFLTQLQNGIAQQPGYNGIYGPAGATTGGGGGGGGGGTTTTTGAIGAGAYVPGQGVPGQGTVFGANNPLTPEENQLYQTLLDNISSAQADINNPANDPAVQAETNAANVQLQQQARNYESQQAEAVGPNANIQAQTAQANEEVGQNTASFQATAMNNMIGQRINEIESMLQGATGLLTQEQQMELSEELSQLQNAQQAYQFDTNANLVAAGLPAA